MATKKDTPQTVEALVLRDCGFGLAGSVVELPDADAKTGAEHGMLDLAPAAVAYGKQGK